MTLRLCPVSAEPLNHAHRLKHGLLHQRFPASAEEGFKALGSVQERGRASGTVQFVTKGVARLRMWAVPGLSCNADF